MLTGPRAGVWRRLALIIVILAAEFAVLEAAMRIEGGSEASSAFLTLFMSDSRVGTRLRPNARARYTTPEFSTDLAINAQGVRDDRDIGPKAADERRIVVLGDSLVLSVQVPIEQTFCKLLETELQSIDPSHHWRVINAGVQGYGPVDEWLFFKNVAEAFQPDIVLVVSFVGNAPAAAAKEAWLDAGGQPPGFAAAFASTGMRRVIRSSMVLQAANVRLTQLKARFASSTPELPVATYLDHPPPIVSHGLDVTRRAVGKITTEAAAIGAKPAIVLMPARFQTDDADYGRLKDIVHDAGGTIVRNAGTERFRDALVPLGVPMLDLLPILEAQPHRDELFFQMNVHLTRRGHEVVAAAIARFLQTSHLVP